MNNQIQTFDKNFLYVNEIPISNGLCIINPTIREILKSGDNSDATFYNLVIQICANPRDFAVQLADLNIKYMKISQYEVFNLLFTILINSDVDTSSVFGDYPIKDLSMIENDDSKLVWVDKNNNVVIDEYTQFVMEKVLRKITGVAKDEGRAGNNIQYEREITKKRQELEKSKNSEMKSSALENEIVTLVNDSNFPYNYETIKDITIYQFNRSLKQVLHSKELDYIKSSAYVGMLDISTLKKEDISLIPID